MNKIVFIVVSVLWSVVAQGQMADRVFLNGKIYTADESQSFAQAMALLDGIIIYIGNDQDVQVYIGDATLVTDLSGKLILPGMHDVHIHILEAAAETGDICSLDPWAWTVADLAQELANCNPQPNANGWIFSWGHSIFTMLEDNANPREVLDSYFPEIPVAAMEETSHSAWVNSAALEELGIDENTPDPDGGHIVLEDGIPNGILLDAAGDMAFNAVFAANNALAQDYYNGMVNFGFPALAENGITSICEGRTYWKRGYIDVWQDLYTNNEFTARVVLAPWAYPEDDNEELINALTELYDEGDDMLRITQIKAYLDGIAIQGTAALDQNYVYNFGWPFYQGLNYFSLERLELLIATLEPMGYDFHVHAIGNRGVKEALDAIEGARDTNGDLGARHRVTHLEIVNEEEFSRFAQLNVTADMQVSANWTQPNQWSFNEDYIGAELSQNYIPLRSVAEAGARVTLSSDWDVSTMNPFRSIQNAVTRAPQELPSVMDAVDAHTINSAYVMRHEHLTGSLEVGKVADLICVDQDIFTIPQNQIASTNVTLTMVSGEVVYENDDFPQSVEQQVSEGQNLDVRPQVTQDYCHVYFDPGSYTSIEVWSATGTLMEKRTINPELNSIQIDVRGWAEGMYVVMAIGEKREGKTRMLVYR
ncbi:MAG: amidohydrolase [Flavobacteriales bacterium]|nr:amidohydrolase [Flavobacteriales bacterium]